MKIKEPQVFGPYLLNHIISEHNGSVYFHATETGTGKSVIVKRMNAAIQTDTEKQNIFNLESDIHLKLMHPAIANAVEKGTADEEDFLVLDDIGDGLTLDSLINYHIASYQAVPVVIALSIMRDILGALSYIHQFDNSDYNMLGPLVYNLTAQSVLLKIDGSASIFTSGYTYRDAATGRTTRSVDQAITRCSAPEQIFTRSSIDSRADIYAAGSILFELLTGRKLISLKLLDENNQVNTALKNRMIRNLHARPSDVNRSLDQFDEIINKTIHHHPEKRYQTADEFIAIIDSALSTINMPPNQKTVAEYIAQSYAKMAKAPNRQTNKSIDDEITQIS
jgi:serine/threonine-protein kinase